MEDSTKIHNAASQKEFTPLPCCLFSLNDKIETDGGIVLVFAYGLLLKYSSCDGVLFSVQS